MMREGEYCTLTETENGLAMKLTDEGRELVRSNLGKETPRYTLSRLLEDIDYYHNPSQSDYADWGWLTDCDVIVSKPELGGECQLNEFACVWSDIDRYQIEDWREELLSSTDNTFVWKPVLAFPKADEGESPNDLKWDAGTVIHSCKFNNLRIGKFAVCGHINHPREGCMYETAFAVPFEGKDGRTFLFVLSPHESIGSELKVAQAPGSYMKQEMLNRCTSDYVESFVSQCIDVDDLTEVFDPRELNIIPILELPDVMPDGMVFQALLAKRMLKLPYEITCTECGEKLEYDSFHYSSGHGCGGVEYRQCDPVCDSCHFKHEEEE